MARHFAAMVLVGVFAASCSGAKEGAGEESSSGLNCGTFEVLTVTYGDPLCRSEELGTAVRGQRDVQSNTPLEAIGVSFDSEGRVLAIQGQPCAVCGPQGLSNLRYELEDDLFACKQLLHCGSDAMRGWYTLIIVNSELPGEYPTWNVWQNGNDGGEWILGPAEVPRNECEPNCTNRECGTDYCGGSCGECSGDLLCDNPKGICKAENVGTGDPGGSGSGGGDSYCDACLQTCEGLDSCCTGKGCICEDDCAPTGCGPGTFLCCGYDGTCLCLEDCPY